MHADAEDNGAASCPRAHFLRDCLSVLAACAEVWLSAQDGSASGISARVVMSFTSGGFCKSSVYTRVDVPEGCHEYQVETGACFSSDPDQIA